MANAAINEEGEGGVPGDYCSALCGRLKIMLRIGGDNMSRDEDEKKQ